MNREIRKELTRLKNAIYNEENISYGELAFLQSHQEEVLQYGDVRLAEWSGITEEEWNNNKLEQNPLKINNFSFSIDDNGNMTIYINEETEKSVATISRCSDMSNKECENLAIEVLNDLGYEISL